MNTTKSSLRFTKRMSELRSLLLSLLLYLSLALFLAVIYASSRDSCSRRASKEVITGFVKQAAEKKVINDGHLNKLLDMIPVTLHDDKEDTTEQLLPSLSMTQTLVSMFITLAIAHLGHQIEAAQGVGFVAIVYLALSVALAPVLLSLSVVVAAIAVFNNHPMFERDPDILNMAQTGTGIVLLAVGKFLALLDLDGGAFCCYIIAYMILAITAGLCPDIPKPSYVGRSRDVTVIIKEMMSQWTLPKQDHVTFGCLCLKVFTIGALLLLATNSIEIVTVLFCFVIVNYEVRQNYFKNEAAEQQYFSVIISLTQTQFFWLTQVVMNICLAALVILLQSHYLVLIMEAPIIIMQVLDDREVYKKNTCFYIGILATYMIYQYFEDNTVHLILCALLALLIVTISNEDKVAMCCNCAIVVVLILSFSPESAAIGIISFGLNGIKKYINNKTTAETQTTPTSTPPPTSDEFKFNVKVENSI